MDSDSLLNSNIDAASAVVLKQLLQEQQSLKRPSPKSQELFSKYCAQLDTQFQTSSEDQGQRAYLLIQYILRFDDLSEQMTVSVFDCACLIFGRLWQSTSKSHEADCILRATLYLLSPEATGQYTKFLQKPAALQQAGLKLIETVLSYFSRNTTAVASIVPTLLRTVVFLTDTLCQIKDMPALLLNLQSIHQWLNLMSFDQQAAKTVLPGMLSKLTNLSTNTKTSAIANAILGDVHLLLRSADVAKSMDTGLESNISVVLGKLLDMTKKLNQKQAYDSMLQILQLFFPHVENYGDEFSTKVLEAGVLCDVDGTVIPQLASSSDSVSQTLSTVFQADITKLSGALSYGLESEVSTLSSSVNCIFKCLPAISTDFGPVLEAAESSNLLVHLNAFTLNANDHEATVALSTLINQIGKQAGSELTLKVYEGYNNEFGKFGLQRLWINYNLIQGMFQGLDEDIQFEYLAKVYECLHKASQNTDDKIICALLNTACLIISNINNELLRPNFELPVLLLQYIGNASSLVKAEAMHTLQLFTERVGYTQPESWVIDNVDYIVDQILRDLTAQRMGANTVNLLSALVELGAEKVSPYLLDIAKAIVAMLRQYHGYELLVLQCLTLFECLSRALCQNISAPELPQIEFKQGPKYTSLDEILAALEEQPDISRIETDVEPTAEKDTMEGDDLELPEPIEPEPVPSNPQYESIKALFKEEANYLTHPSSKVVSRSLKVMEQQTTALASIENEFLPLVNEVWPAICHVLETNDSFASEEAVNLVGTICYYGRDFLNQRFVHLWQALVDKKKSPQRMLRLFEASVGSLRLPPQDLENVVQNLAVICPNKSLASLEHIPPDLSAYLKLPKLLTV